MYKYRFVNYVIVLSLLVYLCSCADNPTEPNPEPKKYIQVDTARRYDWTFESWGNTTIDFCVVDTSNIFIATGSYPVKYDGAQFTVLNMGDNRFHGWRLSAVNTECIFFGGETRITWQDYSPTIKRYINGNIETYNPPADTSASINAVYGISPDKFWAVSTQGLVYYFNRERIKVFEQFKGNYGGKFHLTPEGRLFLIMINQNYSNSKIIVSVNDLIEDEMIHLSSDTLNMNYFEFFSDAGRDLLFSYNKRIYYFDGLHWVNFFNINDFEPYFANALYTTCGGKSRNEFLINTSNSGAPLIFKDGKWIWEITWGPGGYDYCRRVIFYNDRIYFVLSNSVNSASYFYKAKLKNR